MPGEQGWGRGTPSGLTYGDATPSPSGGPCMFPTSRYSANRAAVYIFVAFMIAPGQLVLAQSGTSVQYLYNSYWSTADGFQSTIQFHNNLIADSLSVTTTLYSADGRSVTLEPVVLGALGNASVDLNQELARRGWPESQIGSAAFHYSRKFPGALGAEISVVNAQKGLAYTIPSASTGAASARQHAVFWLPSENAEVYVALQNISAESLQISAVLDVDSRSSQLPVIVLQPRETGRSGFIGRSRPTLRDR